MATLNSKPKHDRKLPDTSGDLIMQRSRPNAPYRSRRDTSYDEEADVALRTALATEEIGIRTLIKVKEQTEQIHNIGDKIVSADQTLVSTDRSIRSMSSFGGRLRNFFFRSEPKTDIQIRKKQEVKMNAKEANAIKKQKAQQSDKKNAVSLTKGRSQKSTGTSNGDERLDAISDSVRTLHLMAQDINQELTTQNRLLSGIGHDFQSLETRLQKQNKQMEKL